MNSSLSMFSGLLLEIQSETFLAIMSTLLTLCDAVNDFLSWARLFIRM